jgi:hypothetical protein
VRRRQSNALRTVLAAAVPVGLVLSAVVWQSTSAAFTATTGNENNSWQAGTVSFYTTTTTALFTAGTPTIPGLDGLLKPGSTRTRCVQVDYTGNLSSDIRLYVTTPTAGASALDPYLEMTVEQGQNVTDLNTVKADCTGFPVASPTVVYPRAADGGAPKTMQDLKTTNKDWTSGIPVGNPVPKDTHLTFRVTYLVKEANEAQGTQSNATFTWEARNT